MTFEEILDQATAMLQRRGHYCPARSRSNFILMRVAPPPSKRNQLRSTTLRSTRMAECWCGWEKRIRRLVLPPLLLPITARRPPLRGISPQLHCPLTRNGMTPVMFCDLVDSTRLSSQLDPEELREVVRAYSRHLRQGDRPL